MDASTANVMDILMENPSSHTCNTEETILKPTVVNNAPVISDSASPDPDPSQADKDGNIPEPGTSRPKRVLECTRKYLDPPPTSATPPNPATSEICKKKVHFSGSGILGEEMSPGSKRLTANSRACRAERWSRDGISSFPLSGKQWKEEEERLALAVTTNCLDEFLMDKTVDQYLLYAFHLEHALEVLQIKQKLQDAIVREPPTPISLSGKLRGRVTR